jgi:hypothetical protein
MFLEGFEFNREESDSPESLLKEEKPPPYTGPHKKFFLFFFYQVWHILFSNTLKKKSEENFHV